MIRSGNLRDRKRLYLSDMLHYQKDQLLIQDHLFDLNGEDGVHHKTHCASMRITNLENGLYLIMPNGDLLRWILKKLPIKFSELRGVFRKEAPSQMDEGNLIDTINDMTSIGVLKV